MSSKERTKPLLSGLRKEEKKLRRKEAGRPTSPEGNCPICLGRIEEKSFANKCFHSFCKTCLFEWSKVKAECPVCRQPFTALLYDVKSMEDYKEKKITPPIVSEPIGMFWSNLDGISRLFRYPTTLTPLRRRILEFQQQLLTHQFPPYSPNPSRNSATSTSGPGTLPSSSYHHRPRHHHHYHNGIDLFGRIRRPNRFQHVQYVISSPDNNRRTSVTSTTTTRVEEIINIGNEEDEIEIPPPTGTSSYRRYIYAKDLWVMPYGNGDKSRRRCASAIFYRSNPACTHRLIPWLNRELLAILDYPCEAEIVLGKIMKSITDYDITSVNFRRVIEPYIKERTDHFIHELYNFAASPYDMEAYSSIAVHVPKDRAEMVRTVSSRNCSNLFEDDTEVTPLRAGIRSPSSSPILINIEDSEEDEEDEKKKKKDDDEEEFINVEVTDLNLNSNTVKNLEEKVNIIDDFDNPQPGPSGINKKTIINAYSVARDTDDSEEEEDKEVVARNKSATPNVSIGKKEEDDVDDKEVMIIGYKKPLHERTPEVVELSSEAEIDVVGNEEGEDGLLKNDCGRILSFKRPLVVASSAEEEEDNYLNKRRKKTLFYGYHMSSSSSSEDEDEFGGQMFTLTLPSSSSSSSGHQEMQEFRNRKMRRRRRRRRSRKEKTKWIPSVIVDPRVEVSQEFSEMRTVMEESEEMEGETSLEELDNLEVVNFGELGTLEDLGQ